MQQTELELELDGAPKRGGEPALPTSLRTALIERMADAILAVADARRERTQTTDSARKETSNDSDAALEDQA